MLLTYNYKMQTIGNFKVGFYEDWDISAKLKFSFSVLG